MNKEFIEKVYILHLQNTNGRETPDEMFQLGIEACCEEMKDELIKAIIHGHRSSEAGTELSKTIEKYDAEKKDI